jgi:hypothetical protein
VRLIASTVMVGMNFFMGFQKPTTAVAEQISLTVAREG